MMHLLHVVAELRGRGARSLNGAVDAATPRGTPGLHVFGAPGRLLRERTGAGLRAAVARGRVGGRPVAAAPEKVARSGVRIAGGLTVREAASRLELGTPAHDAALAMHASDSLPR